MIDRAEKRLFFEGMGRVIKERIWSDHHGRTMGSIDFYSIEEMISRTMHDQGLTKVSFELDERGLRVKSEKRTWKREPQ